MRLLGPGLQKWLLLLAIVMMWGSSPAFTKIALERYLPVEIVFYRLAVGCVLLWMLAIWQRPKLAFSPRYLRFFFVAALFGSALPWVLIGWGQKIVPSGLTAVLFAVMPLATIVLAHFSVSGERLTNERLLGFLIGFAGIVVLVGPEALAEIVGDSARFLPQLAILAGALCYAINVIVSRNRPSCDPLAAATGTLTASLILSAPAMLAFAEPTTGFLIDPPTLAIAALGIIGTAVPTMLFFRLVSLAGTGFTALINYLIPVWGFWIGVTVMAEPLEWHALLALAMILGGIMLSERRPRSHRSQ